MTRRFLFTALLLFCFAISSVGKAWQQEKKSEQEPVLQLKTELIEVRAVVTDAQGNYTRTNVPTSSPTGTVRVSGLPGGCTPANPTANYTGLTTGATVAAPDIQITCPSTSNNYEFTITFSPISAGKTTMTAKIDMTTRNDPANNGAGPDKIGGFQATINYPTARLSAPACTAGQLTGVINTSTAGKITPVLTNIPAGATGNAVLLFSCTFDVTGTGPTPIGVTAPAFGDPTGSVDFTAFVNLTLQDVP